MLNFVITDIKNKHYFILYNNDEGKWYEDNKKLQVINKWMGFKELYTDKQRYVVAKAKAWKAEQENRKIINDRKHFHSAY